MSREMEPGQGIGKMEDFKERETKMFIEFHKMAT
jgi:hypothetical protein